MHILFILTALFAIISYRLINRYRCLSHNVALAKSTGLPVVVMPWNVFAIFWLVTYKLWTPILRKFLPKSMQGTWIELLDPEWAQNVGYKPFAELGKDVFLTAAPHNIQAYVADAEAVTQVTTRRNDFPKPLEMYGALDIYGKNLVSTEGSDWRVHRKLVAPSFGERNNLLVFTESLHHAQSLLGLWTGPDGRGDVTIQDPSTGAMDFALYVISSAGFDVRVEWPHEEAKKYSKREEDGKSVAIGFKGSSGHKMSYRQALSELLHNIMWTQIIPPKYLPKSPVKVHRRVGAAVAEWGEYMDEIYERKKSQVVAGEDKGGMDLFDALIRGSGIVDPKNTKLQKSDLLGNAFVLMLAGHETTANTLHFSLIYLAMNRQSQIHLQQDIDKIFQGKPISEWKYEEHFPKLFGSMAAAVMNETLRLLQPIINIPKSTSRTRPQPITVGDEQYILPAGIHLFLSAAIHRNPKYWPAPSSVTGTTEDVNSFRPERWLVETKLKDNFKDIDYDDEELRGPSGEDTSSQLFKPVRGSYIPFSDGFRSCIGRRFAQVEILAVLAVVFSQYSVELAMDDFATDEEVAKMSIGGQERKTLYKKAVDRADLFLRTKVGSIITLQLRGVTIPIRMVPRGQEKFGPV